MADTKDSVNISTDLNITGDSKIDIVYNVGTALSSVCIIINGLLLICIFNNRKKSWIKNRQEFTSLVASDFVTGVVLIVVFAVRQALGPASVNVLRLVEEAIYFTSKCITINHLLLMCFNSLLHLKHKNQTEGRNNSYHAQSLLIWMTTLSWLVIPFVILGNGCSTLWFTECALQVPTIMLQYLSFMFGLPLILVNIFCGTYGILVFKQGYTQERTGNKHFQSKAGSQLRDESQKRHLLCFRDHSNIANMTKINESLSSKTLEIATSPNLCSAKDTAKPYRPDACIVHNSSFKTKHEKAKERGIRQTTKRFITTGLMLLALDISVWPIVFSFVRLLFKVDVPGSHVRSLIILTFSNQVANPIIYLMTMPNLRLTSKKMLQISIFPSGKNKASRARFTPPLTCRFKQETPDVSNGLCSCPINRTRRRTTDVILEKEQDRKRLFIRNRPHFQSDSLLSRDVNGAHKCVNTTLQDNPSHYFADNLLHLSLRRKHSLMSGRSVLSGGGFSIEMDSQVSVNDILSCRV